MQFLNKIRVYQKEDHLKKKIIITILIFLLGIILGIFSKWLDNLAIDDSISWQRLIGSLDLGNFFSEMAIWLFLALIISIYSKTPIRASINVFVFFVGVTISYHAYTILFSGFNPQSYMMIWYTLTVLSPLLAFICWYAKSNHFLSMIISSMILSIMIILSFSIGFWYFDIRNILYLITFLGTLIILYVSPKNTLISLFIGIMLAYLIRLVY